MRYSTIIPVYNCKAFLPACVDSIRSVGAEDYEILLIDDGSTDGSGAVCDALAGEHPEIRVVHQENAGASAARNRGIREAKGEYLLFVDADDGVEPEMLQAAMESACRERSDMVLFGMTFDYYYRGKCYRRDPLVYQREGILTARDWGECFEELFLANAWSPIWNKIYKRDILLKNGLLFREDMFLYEDLEFVLRYLAFCDRIWNVPQAIYHYRQSEDEGNAGRRLKRINSIPEFLKPIEAALRALPEAVSETDRAMVLQQLHLVLVREKIAVSDLRAICGICMDYQKWSENHLLPMEQDTFQQRLLACKAMELYLENKKTQMRHWVAVRVKALIRGFKK